MDYCDQVIEDVLVDICLHGMIEEYHLHLENLSFASFSRLMEAARRKNESVRKIVSYNLVIRPSLKKMPLVAAVKRSGGSRGSSSK